MSIKEFRKHIIEDDNHMFELIKSCNSADTCRDSDNIITSKYRYKTLDECLNSKHIFARECLGDWKYSKKDNALKNQEFCSYGNHYTIKNVVYK